MKAFLLTLALSLGLATSAIAQQTLQAPTQPAACALTFDVHTDNFILINYGGGTGVVRCQAADGSWYQHAVNIEIRGLELGLSVFHFWGIANNLGVFTPDQLQGTYTVGDAAAGLVLAAGASVGFSGSNGVQFMAKLQGGTGLGANIGLTTWTFTLAD